MTIARLGWVLVLGLVHCDRSPPPPRPPLGGTVATPASSQAPSVSTSGVPQAPAASVWTTPSESDECREFSAKMAPHHAHFATLSACQDWVRTRSCRPGFRCYDGCNWRSCDDDGSGFMQTLAGCSRRAFELRFRPGTSKPTEEADWDSIAAQVVKQLVPAQRKVELLVHVSTDNPRTSRQLGQSRAQLVRRELTKRGVSDKRIAISLSDAAPPPSDGGSAHDSVVVSMIPPTPLREELDPSTEEHRLFCAAPHRSGS